MNRQRINRLVMLSYLLVAFAASNAHAAPYITAAIRWTGGKVQFFLSDATYLRFDILNNRVDPGYPKPITDKTWPGMAMYGDKIAAAFTGSNGKAFFFLSTGKYLRYDIALDQTDQGYPIPVNDLTWPGMGQYGTQLIGALNWPDNKVHLFLKNGMFLRFDVEDNRIDDGYPKPINQQTWPSLYPYVGHMSGMVNWENDKAYIFLDNATYLRYDIRNDRVDAGYPKPITDGNWPGMGKIFFRREMP